MSITEETRYEALKSIEPKRSPRCKIILDQMSDGEMTAGEIAMALFEAKLLPYFSRNFVAPRLTEMQALGLVKTVGKRRSKMTGAMEAVWARK